MSSLWQDVGDLLDLNTPHSDGILTHCPGDVWQCCRDVLQDWINNGSYPATWDNLLTLLKDFMCQIFTDSFGMFLVMILYSFTLS